MYKKIFAIILTFTIVTLCFLPCIYAENEEAAYITIEAQTGEAVYSENADEKFFPAGLTKLMSYLILFEALDDGRVSQSDMVSISKNAASKGGTSVFLDEGTKYPFGVLLRAAIVSSGNDAVTALAEHTAGTEAAFTDMMNEHAERLGLTAHFADPTGLDTATSVSAADLAKTAAALEKHSGFFDHSGIWTYTFSHTSGRETELTSANKLIKTDGFDGMATGSSKEAGYCVCASYKDGAARFISVVLGAKSSEKRFEKARELSNSAAAAYSVCEIARAGEKVKDVPVKGARINSVGIYAAEDLTLLVKKEDEKNISREINISEICAPVKKGEVVGSMTVTLSDGRKHDIPLSSGEEIEASDLSSGLIRILGLWLKVT